jgi:hypothetical protein
LLLKEEYQDLKKHVLKAINDKDKFISPKKKKKKKTKRNHTMFFSNDLIGMNLAKQQTAGHNYSNGNSPSARATAINNSQ